MKVFGEAEIKLSRVLELCINEQEVCVGAEIILIEDFMAYFSWVERKWKLCEHEID